jgi:hypothetical protein
LILLSVLQLVALVASFLWYHYGRRGRVALPPDSEDEEEQEGATGGGGSGGGDSAEGEGPEDGYVSRGGTV